MDPRSSPLGGGDLGRRVIDHRERAGLTRPEAARLADLSVSYLTYLETSSAPRPSPGDLDRLASVLGTSPAALLGVGLSGPPGQQHPDHAPEPEPLTAGECRGYLAQGGIGRIVYLADRGPAAVPVNYRMLGDDIVFRTGARSGPADAAARPQVSFEVDHVDDVLAEGWSVLVTGRAEVLTAASDLAGAGLPEIVTWAGGERDCYVRVIPEQITGRRIRLAP
jgi:transcriptional regulator with XRE-family HTH domain